MLRRFPSAILALALVFAAEPLLHSHPLQSSGSSATNACAVCAASVDRPIDSPAVAAPLHVIALVDDAPLAAAHGDASILLSSRAPPAAA